MKKSYYHATPFENLDSILENGLRRGYDGIIYMTETPEDAVKFLRIRLCTDALIIKLDLDESKVIETFDHNESFFKCKAFGYKDDIPAEEINESHMLRWRLY